MHYNERIYVYIANSDSLTNDHLPISDDCMLLQVNTWIQIRRECIIGYHFLLDLYMPEGNNKIYMNTKERSPKMQIACITRKKLSYGHSIGI